MFPLKKTRFSFQAPHHKRRARQTVVTSANIPDVRVPDCRRSFDGWAEETLAEPHRNKALGCHDSYLRGIWHLKCICIEVSISDGANWGVHESPKDFAWSPVTFFHFLSLFSLPSSSSLPFPAGGAELALTAWKGKVELLWWSRPFLPFNFHRRFLDSAEQITESIRTQSLCSFDGCFSLKGYDRKKPVAVKYLLT